MAHELSRSLRPRHVTMIASAMFVYVLANNRAWSATVPPWVVAIERSALAIVAVGLVRPQ